MTILHAGCKINLSLHVGQKHDDGYHEIDSIFYPLMLPADIITIFPSALPGLSIDTNENIAGQNILSKIYDLFAEKTGFQPSLKLFLKKNIPMGAGLGGGSSDAAQFLGWLNSRAKKPLSEQELMELAIQAGSDIPFFLVNKSARIQGKGDIISPFSLPFGRLGLILVCPPIHVNTAFAYSALDDSRNNKSNFSNVENSLTKQDCQNKKTIPSSAMCAEEKIFGIDNLHLEDLHNDLEEPVFRHYPQLSALKEKILDCGACHAAMSGSGSSIFGLFRDSDKMRMAFGKLRQEYAKVYAASIK